MARESGSIIKEEWLEEEVMVNLEQVQDSGTTGPMESTLDEIISGSGTGIKIYNYWEEDLDLGDEKAAETSMLDKVPREGRRRVRKVRKRNKPFPSLVGIEKKNPSRKKEAADILEKPKETESSGDRKENSNVSSQQKIVTLQANIKEEPIDDALEEAVESVECNWAEEIEETNHAQSPYGHDVPGVLRISGSHSLQGVIKEEPIEDGSEAGGSSGDLEEVELARLSGESPHEHDDSLIILLASIKEDPDHGNIVRGDRSLVTEDLEYCELAGSCDQSPYKPGESKEVNRVDLKIEAPDNKYTCRLCGKQYNKAKHMEQHTRAHYGQTGFFECGFCEYRFTHSEDLETHMRIHTGDLPFACEFCDCKCSQQGQLAIHMTFSHCSCNLCTYLCTNPSELDIHKKTHIAERPFACDFCDFSCSKKRDLEMHIKAHTCDFCDYKCALEGQLEIHKRTHFACDLCNYKCTGDELEMEIHMKTHYTCSICRYRCSEANHLKVHTKSHLKKSYICDSCRYSSTNYSFYRKHLSNHKKKMFKCKMCVYKCDVESNLKRHINQKHSL